MFPHVGVGVGLWVFSVLSFSFTFMADPLVCLCPFFACMVLGLWFVCVFLLFLIRYVY